MDEEDQEVARGRPWRRRRPPEPGRRARLTVEYTDQEWARVRELAAAARWSTGAWVALRSLDPGDVATRAGVDSVTAAALIELMRAMRQLGAIGGNLNQITRAVNRFLAAADSRQEDQDVARLAARLAAVTRPLPALCAELTDVAVLARDALVAVSRAASRRQRRRKTTPPPAQTP